MKHFLASIIILGFVMTAVVYGQEESPGSMPQPDGMRFDNEPGREGPPSEAKLEQIRKKIEAVRIWRLTEELKMNEGTAVRLSSFLSSIEEKRRGLIHTNIDTIRELRMLLTSGKPDMRTIKAGLEKIEKNQRELFELKQKELNGIKDILTIEQQARYVVFDHEFQNEMRRMISGARNDGLSRGGMPQGHGSNRWGPPPGSIGNQ